MYCEIEQECEKSCPTPGLHPQPVAVSSHGHAGGGEELFRQLEVLVLLQERWKALDSQRPAALL